MLSVVIAIKILELFWLRGAEAHQNDPHHFVLVHGAGHGAWCWYKVEYLLRQAGHTVDAIDLLSAGINNFDPDSVGTLERYSSPLVQFIETLPRNQTIVLVGHSFGGATVTYAMEMFPDKIATAIYVAALMLPSGPDAIAINNQLLSGHSNVQSSTHSISFHLDFVQDLFYNRSPRQDVVLAKSLLKPMPLLSPEVNFTQENYGRIPRYYIKTAHDNVVPPEDQELLIRTTPPQGVKTISSDHSPFFSKPSTLVSLLKTLASLHNS